MARTGYRRLRAPQEDGAALVEPSAGEAASLIEDNRKRVGEAECLWLNQPLVAAAQSARRELFDLALAHTAQYRDTSFLGAVNRDRPFLLAGHQPELFHPGVWFKNFLLSSLAERTGAVPVNLIIDTDAVHGVGIRVPSSVDGQVQAPMIPFDAAGAAIAWEERAVVDPELFASFPRRVTAAFGGFVPAGSQERLLVNPLWQCLSSRSVGGRLGMALAQARHKLEGDIGLKTLEAPMSSVAQTVGFRRFAVHLLQNLNSLREIYNAGLDEYRHTNRIRSRTHPAPALAERDGWLEAPFFVWTKADPGRRALFVRPRAKSLELSDREQLSIGLELVPEKAIEQLATYEAQGIKLRPRALITTMYARLLLSDLFIHGIGGAKYDELTDLIMRRFFGVEPPAYMTATATFRLPIERPDVTESEVRESAERLRATRYRPETLLNHPLVAHGDLAPKLSSLASEKREFLAAHQVRRCAHEVFQQFDALNAAMRELLRPVEQQLTAQHDELLRSLARAKVLQSREFSFVLFNSEILPARLLDLCKVSS